MIPPESGAVIDNAAEFVDVECDIRLRRILDFKRCATLVGAAFLTTSVRPPPQACSVEPISCAADPIRVMSALEVRPRNPHLRHPADQRGAFQAKSSRCAFRAADHPTDGLQGLQNQRAF